jgi:hypothetical protein
MASPSSDGPHLWTDCFTKIGEQNRVLFQTFLRGASEQNLAFLQRRMEQRSQLAERLQRQCAELLEIQQDFAKQAVGDWVEHAHKLGTLYWETVEDRMEQTTQTIASIIPFTRNADTPAGDRRKAA